MGIWKFELEANIKKTDTLQHLESFIFKSSLLSYHYRHWICLLAKEYELLFSVAFFFADIVKHLAAD